MIAFRRLLLALLAVAALTGAARAAPSQRELDAREAFAAGRYEQALDLFAKLYAETLHPTYLRNIGRCQQNLGQPDKAIASFHEYLRKARGLPAEERAEVEGYIKEMEELKRRSAVPEPTAVRPPPAVVQQPPLQVREAPIPPPPESPPLYRRGWFWVAVGAVVLAGVAGGLAAGGAFSGKDPSCPAGVSCQ
jgi:tetratricopeptide (TPR) repeat protein